MRHNWVHFVRRLLLALAATLLLGWVFGEMALAALLFLSAYLTWTLVQAFRLHTWLYKGLLTNPPESRGLWGELFDGIYRLQMQHARSRDSLQALIDRVQESANALRDAVVMTDSSGALEWWNQAASTMLGFRFPTDRGVMIQNLLRAPEFKAYFLSKQYHEPLLLNAPNDRHLKLQLQITLFGEDDRLLLIQDVSRLTRLEEIRRDFVSNVSHELRTPLTVITGYLETMVDSSDDFNPRWRKAMLQMQNQASRMEALINDLLLLSKIENQGRSFRQAPIDIAAMLQNIRDDARALIGARKIALELHIDTDLTITGEETLLHSAFSNLVFNAVKYTPDSGSITMRWHRDGNGIHFTVTDTGIGIDPIHIPRITERFYRADPSRNSSSGGTGLGLAIVKHVLLNHDATLEVKSAPGKGSRFTCHFPASRVVQPDAIDNSIP